MPETKVTPDSAKSRRVTIVCCVAILALFAFLYFGGSPPYLFGVRWPLQCQLREVFGIKCALCGMTRSFRATAYGNLRAAFSFHHLGPALYFFVLLQIPFRLLAIASGPKANRRLKKINLFLAGVIGTAIVVNWIVYLGTLII